MCAHHGTFFDAGELPRVLEFVRRGGLAKAHAVLQNRPPPPSPAGSLDAPHATSSPGIAEDLVDLVGFVVDVLHRR